MRLGRPRIRHICLGPSSGGGANGSLAAEEGLQDAVDLSEFCYLQSVDPSGKPCCISEQYSGCAGSRLRLQCGDAGSDARPYKDFSSEASRYSSSANLHPRQSPSSPVFLNTPPNFVLRNRQAGNVEPVEVDCCPSKTNHKKRRISERLRRAKIHTKDSSNEDSRPRCEGIFRKQFGRNRGANSSRASRAVGEHCTRIENSLLVGSSTTSRLPNFLKNIKQSNLSSSSDVKNKKRGSRRGGNCENIWSPKLEGSNRSVRTRDKCNVGRRVLSRTEFQKKQNICTSKKENAGNKQLKDIRSHHGSSPCKSCLLTDSIVPESKIADELLREVKVEPPCSDEVAFASDGIIVKHDEDRNLRPIVIVISDDTSLERRCTNEAVPKTSLSTLQCPFESVKFCPIKTNFYGNDFLPDIEKYASNIENEQKYINSSLDGLGDNCAILKFKAPSSTSSSRFSTTPEVAFIEGSEPALSLEGVKNGIAFADRRSSPINTDQRIRPNDSSDSEISEENLNQGQCRRPPTDACPRKASPNNAANVTSSKVPRLYGKRNYLANHFCRICHLIFPTIGKLRAHKRLHVRRFRCQFCTKIICSEGQFFKHLEEVHRMILVVPDLEVEHRTLGKEQKISHRKPSSNLTNAKRKYPVNSKKMTGKDVSDMNDFQSVGTLVSRSVNVELGITVEAFDRDEEPVDIVLNELCASEEAKGNNLTKNTANCFINNGLIQCDNKNPFILKEDNKSNALDEVEPKIPTMVSSGNSRHIECHVNGKRFIRDAHTSLEERSLLKTEGQKRIINQRPAHGGRTGPCASVCKIENDSVLPSMDADEISCQKRAGWEPQNKCCWGTLPTGKLADGSCSKIYSGSNSVGKRDLKHRLSSTSTRNNFSKKLSVSELKTGKNVKLGIKDKVQRNKGQSVKMSNVRSSPQLHANLGNFYNLRSRCVNVGEQKNASKVTSRNVGSKFHPKISERAARRRVSGCEDEDSAAYRTKRGTRWASHKKVESNSYGVIQGSSEWNCEGKNHLGSEVLPLVDKGRVKVAENTTCKLNFDRSSRQMGTHIQGVTNFTGEEVVKILSTEHNWGPRKETRASGQVVLKRKTDIYSHVQMTREEKTYPCPFKGCRRVMASAAALKYHRETHEALSFECHLCAKVFRHKLNLRNHLLVHQERRYECSTCNRKFRQNIYLQRHIQERHLKLPVHSCKVCSEKFVSYRELVRHCRRHSFSGGRKFICVVCRVGFVRKAHLTAHSSQHLVTSNSHHMYACKFCPDLIIFRTFVSVKRHHFFVHPDEFLPSPRDCKLVVVEESCVDKNEVHLNQDSSFKKKKTALERLPLPSFAHIAEQRNAQALSYDSFSVVYGSEDEVERAAETKKAIQSIQNSYVFPQDENSGVEVVDDAYFQGMTTDSFDEEPKCSLVQVNNREPIITSDEAPFKSDYDLVNEAVRSAGTSDETAMLELTSKVSLCGGYIDEPGLASPTRGQPAHSDSIFGVTYAPEFVDSKLPASQTSLNLFPGFMDDSESEHTKNHELDEKTDFYILKDDSTYDPVSEYIGHNVEIPSSNPDPSYFNLCTNSVDPNNNFDSGSYSLVNIEDLSKLKTKRMMTTIGFKEEALMNASFGDSDGFESGYLSCSFASEVARLPEASPRDANSLTSPKCA